jgi:hypothetical protein
MSRSASRLVDLDLRDFNRFVERHAPEVNKVFFGRKYVLPKYREADYVSLEPTNYLELDRLLQFSSHVMAFDDDVSRCAIGTTVASLCYNRPVLWLEKELADMLLRTRLLDDLSTGDIKWKWPAFKIMLPLSISLDFQGRPRPVSGPLQHLQDGTLSRRRRAETLPG